MGKKHLKIGFLLDPMEKIRPEDDTSFSLMLESHRRGHEVIYLEMKDIFHRNNAVQADMRVVVPHRKKGFLIKTNHQATALKYLDVLFIRKDPPFDLNYLYLTYLLESVRDEVLIINDPRGIRDANEKLYLLHFPDLIPAMVVSQKIAVLQQFITRMKEVVIKPLHNKGGKGIFYLKAGNHNIPSLLEVCTEEEKVQFIAQKFLGGKQKIRDKRILLLAGKPLGAFVRVPGKDDFRANLTSGGKLLPGKVRATDRMICERLEKKLCQDGLFFVGIDIIAGKLTEVNVTSPAGIPEINNLSGTKLESTVLDWVEDKIRN